MDFTLSEEQEILKKFARDFLTEKFTKKTINELEKGLGHSSEIWQEMASLGWQGLAFPENYGGAGMGFLDLGILLEEMGKAGAVSPYFSTVVLGGIPINNFGTEEQKKTYLPGIASGEKLISLALYEKSAKFEPNAIEMPARLENGQWVINGEKLFVPYAHVCDYLLCLARTGGGKRSEDSLTIFIVETKAPGMQIALQSTRIDKLSEVIFKDVKVTQKNILGKLNQGWNIARKIIDIATVARCCQMLGLAQKAIDMTIDYSKERKQYGRPVATFQAMQHHGAELTIDIFGMRVGIYRAAWTLSQGLSGAREIAIARNWAIQASERIISLVFQMHGAIGVTLDYDLRLYTGQLKAYQMDLANLNFYADIFAREIGL